MGKGKLLDETPIDGPPVTPMSGGGISGGYKGWKGFFEFIGDAIGIFEALGEDDSSKDDNTPTGDENKKEESKPELQRVCGNCGDTIPIDSDDGLHFNFDTIPK